MAEKIQLSEILKGTPAFIDLFLWILGISLSRSIDLQ
jgi:hypothetical protein